MQTKNIIYGIIIGLITTLGVALVGGALLQLSTNTNNVTLGPQNIQTLFNYTVNGTIYSNEAPINWGNNLTRGLNTNTYNIVVHNIHTESIIVSFLNGTMPSGWIITSSYSSLNPIISDGDLTIIITLTIPDECVEGLYSFNTTIRATAA